MKKLLGIIISGSLTDGFQMRIAPNALNEDIKTGKFVSIEGENCTFFSLITDISLGVSHPDILLFPPTKSESLLCSVLNKKDVYATALLKPMLMLTKHKKIASVKTVPIHFSSVYEADQKDIAFIFGDEHDKSGRYFKIGFPIDMTTGVCLDLEKLTERSNGIFGKTGTGKTFLTRLLLTGLLKQEKAVTLIFDMHSEYGLQARKEEGTPFVKGLKTLFGNKVAIFSLDPEATKRRGAIADVEINFSYNSITLEDILALQDELNLHTTAFEAGYILAARYKQEWLQVLLNQGEHLKEFAQELGAHPESIAALYRKLKRIERLPFLKPVSNNAQNTSVIDLMMEYIAKGISIVIEFGNYNSTLCYLLIANIITRRIHAEYISRTEFFLGSHRKEDEPRKLMIVIEEAHKFLNPQAAKQTIFGVIAREMRKYYVSLLIVDQRPSCIDNEIISQIGTKIIAQLNDEKDINSVLSGTANAAQLRTILSCLDSKKQVLIVGHAITMPVLIQTREYDELFYESIAPEMNPQKINELIHEIF